MCYPRHLDGSSKKITFSRPLPSDRAFTRSYKLFKFVFRLNFCMSKFLRWTAAILHFLVMRKRNCHVNTGLSLKIENITFTILHCWVMRVRFESTWAPSVASRFPLCIQYTIAKFIYLFRSFTHNAYVKRLTSHHVSCLNQSLIRTYLIIALHEH